MSKASLFDMWRELLRRADMGPTYKLFQESVSFHLDDTAVSSIQMARREKYDPEIILANARVPVQSMFVEYVHQYRLAGHPTNTHDNAGTEFRCHKGGLFITTVERNGQRLGYMRSVDLYHDGHIALHPYQCLWSPDGLLDKQGYVSHLQADLNPRSYQPILLSQACEKVLWGDLRPDTKIPHKGIMAVGVTGVSFMHDRLRATAPMYGRTEQPEQVREFAGDLAFVLFLLSMMNTSAASAHEVTTKGRFIYRGNTRPLSNFTRVSINLEKRYVDRPGKGLIRAITAHHNRRHGVRGHWRKLASGKSVWVRDHERGDETLGRVTQRYEIVDRTGMTREG